MLAPKPEDPFVAELAVVERRLATLGADTAFAPLIAHVLAAPGKRLRARLVLASAALGPRASELFDDAVQAALAVELLHEASLVHDDICDSSATRRGRPSLAAKFDIRSAALAASYLAGRGLSLAGELGMRRRVAIDFRLLVALSRGQILEEAPNEEATIAERRARYLAVVGAKTGALFRIATQLGGIVGYASDAEHAALARFADHLAIAYQVLDDVRDLEAPPSLGKEGGGDLARGIFTWPVLEWLERSAEGARAELAARYANEGKDELEAHRLRSAIVSSGAGTAAVEFAEAQVAGALEALRALPASRGAQHLAELVRRAGRR